jgi:hypothetical protein
VDVLQILGWLQIWREEFEHMTTLLQVFYDTFSSDKKGSPEKSEIILSRKSFFNLVMKFPILAFE